MTDGLGRVPARSEDPTNAACSFNYYYAFRCRRNECVFEVLNVLENAQNLARTSDPAKNLIFRGKHTPQWKNGSTAPPTKLQKLSPRIYFHLELRNSVHSCNMPRRTKNSLAHIPETQQEVGHFEKNGGFWPILGQNHTFSRAISS